MIYGLERDSLRLENAFGFHPAKSGGELQQLACNKEHCSIRPCENRANGIEPKAAYCHMYYR